MDRVHFVIYQDSETGRVKMVVSDVNAAMIFGVIRDPIS